MTLTSTRYKLKYNRNAYRRYEFSLGVDSKLNALVERYKIYPDANLTRLLKTCLCDYFGITIQEADDYYPAYFFTSTSMRINPELDKYFDQPTAVNPESSILEAAKA